jgi:hypothetical protein
MKQRRKTVNRLIFVATLGIEINSISLSRFSLRLCDFARKFSLGVLGASVVQNGSLHPELSRACRQVESTNDRLEVSPTGGTS